MLLHASSKHRGELIYAQPRAYWRIQRTVNGEGAFPIKTAKLVVPSSTCWLNSRISSSLEATVVYLQLAKLTVSVFPLND